MTLVLVGLTLTMFESLGFSESSRQAGPSRRSAERTPSSQLGVASQIVRACRPHDSCASVLSDAYTLQTKTPGETGEYVTDCGSSSVWRNGRRGQSEQCVAFVHAAIIVACDLETTERRGRAASGSVRLDSPWHRASIIWWYVACCARQRSVRACVFAIRAPCACALVDQILFRIRRSAAASSRSRVSDIAISASFSI